MDLCKKHSTSYRLIGKKRLIGHYNLIGFFSFHAFLLRRTPHLSDGYGYVGRAFFKLSYLPGSLFLGSCPSRVCILVTSSFHLPISSASPGSLNRDSQRNFPFGAGITFFLMLHIVA